MQPLSLQQNVAFEANAIAVDLRAISYFRRDWRWIAVLVLLIAVSVLVGLLEAWPLAILVDSVLTQTPRSDRIHQLFLSFLPPGKMGQVVGLVLFGMGLQIIGYAVWMARMMINLSLIHI